MNVFTRMFDDFRESLRGMKKTRTLAACAMLLTLAVVLDYFASFYLTPTIKISLSFIAIAACGMLFGPVPAMICGGLQDVLMWLIKPAGMYFPGYTLSSVLAGLIYGLCLYRRSDKKLYIMAPISKLLVNLFVNLLLNTCWSMMFTGKAYLVLLPGRAIKNLAALPVEAAILIAVMIFLNKNRSKLAASK
jgi:ECF transporter S component (folate family)